MPNSISQTRPEVNPQPAPVASGSGEAHAFIRCFPNEVRPADLSRGTMPHRGEPVDLLTGERAPTGMTATFTGCQRLGRTLYFNVRVDGLSAVRQAVDLYLQRDHEPDPEPMSPGALRRLEDLRELAARYNRIAALALEAGKTINRAARVEAQLRRRIRARAPRAAH